MDITEHLKRNGRLVIACEKIIDWYDGEVQTIFRLENVQPWIYCSLLAWDMDNRTKIYAMFPIGDAAANLIVDLLEASKEENKTERIWESIGRHIANIVANNCKGVHIIKCGHLDSEIENWKIVNPNVTSKHTAMDIEDIIDSKNVRFWLQKMIAKEKRIPPSA